MNVKNIFKVKRLIKPQNSQPLSNDSAIEYAVKALQQTAIKTQPLLKAVVEQEATFETPRDESVYGCGWSLTELLNEFNER